MKHLLTILYILVNTALGIICFKTSGYVTIGGLLLVIVFSCFSFANYLSSDDPVITKYLKPAMCLIPSITFLLVLFRILLETDAFSKVLF